jgi:hypothetical protein
MRWVTSKWLLRATRQMELHGGRKPSKAKRAMGQEMAANNFELYLHRNSDCQQVNLYLGVGNFLGKYHIWVPRTTQNILSDIIIYYYCSTRAGRHGNPVYESPPVVTRVFPCIPVYPCVSLYSTINTDKHECTQRMQRRVYWLSVHCEDAKSEMSL